MCDRRKAGSTEAGAPASSGLRAWLVVVGLSGACFLETFTPPPILAQSWSTLRASRQSAGESELEVVVEYGVGRFTLSANTGRQLYDLQLRYDEDAFEPVHEFEDSRLLIGVDEVRGSRFRRGSMDGQLDLGLSSEVPMDLELEFGAVRADLDLGRLRLRELSLVTGASDAEIRVSAPNPEPMGSVSLTVGAASLQARELGRLNAEEFSIEAGVGDVRLDFAGIQREETRIKIEMGVGNLEIQVPSDAGIRLTRNSFLTSLEAPELQRRGEAFLSPNWETSARRVEIDVDAAFGKVSILRTD